MLKSDLSPPFEALIAHLFRSGVTAIGEMQRALVLPDVREVAAFRLGFDQNRFHLVTVTLSDDEAAAARVEEETRRVPQVSGVNRNGPFVMACTFNPADPILEQRFTAAFMSFQAALRTTT